MKTIFLYLDGFKYDYLERCQFLKKFADKNHSARLKVVPLHQFEFNIFSGSLDHDLWVWYYLDSKTSPYKWLKPWINILKIFDKNKFLSKIMRMKITYFSSLIYYFKGRTRFVKIAKIPLDKAPLFSVTAKKCYIDKNPMNKPTIFDVLRKNKTRYLTSEWPLISNQNQIKLKPWIKSEQARLNYLFKKSNQYDFLFVHLWKLDTLMHQYGTESREVNNYLKDMDKMLKDFVVKMIRKYKHVKVIISSDHGMVDIKGSINVIEKLRKNNLRENIDFISFPGSIMVRLWCKRNKEKTKKVLEKIPNGKLYDETNFSELGFKYKRKLVGDYLFLADSGYQIIPNYFDGFKMMKAEHGYKPVKDELDGIFISSNKIGKKEIILTDIFDLVLK